MNAKCITCEAPLSIASDTEVGELILCTDCGAELEIESMTSDQVNLVEAPEEEEDWGQ